jgi:hypothetical protein
MWTLLESGNNKPPKYDFTTRLGHDLHEKGLTFVSKTFTLPPIRHNIGSKYGYFQQDQDEISYT